ncbi:MAG: lactonase family protein [Gemmatimonadaceae bacterium]
MRAATAFRLLSIAFAATAAACTDNATTNPITTNPRVSSAASLDAQHDEATTAEGAVYTMTNATSGNEVVAFHRAADGSLAPIGSFATGGAGTGGKIDPLASQYSLLLSDDHKLLFAVNAGSNQVTSFRVAEDGELSRARITSTGGVAPVSLAMHGNLLYVLNTGSASVQGYRVGASGELAALPGASATLPTGSAGAAAIRFTRDGEQLLVTERGANRIDVFDVRENGRLAAVATYASHGRAAFGFDLTPDDGVIVSETGSNAPNGGVSSYVLGGGTLTLVTGSVSSGGGAACWLINTRDGRFSYVVNAGGASIGAFAMREDGSIASIGGAGALTSTGAGSTPLDPAFSSGDRYLYVLEGGAGNIGGFAVGPDGALTAAGTVHAGAGASGLQGLAAF